MHFITQNDEHKTIANNIKSREREVWNYDLNLSNYTAAIAHIDTQYPDGWGDLNPLSDPLTLTEEEQEHYNAMVFRSQLLKLKQDTVRERGKAATLLAVLEAQAVAADIDVVALADPDPVA
jgi:hypothetical protein